MLHSNLLHHGGLFRLLELWCVFWPDDGCISFSLGTRLENIWSLHEVWIVSTLFMFRATVKYPTKRNLTRRPHDPPRFLMDSSVCSCESKVHNLNLPCVLWFGFRLMGAEKSTQSSAHSAHRLKSKGHHKWGIPRSSDTMNLEVSHRGAKGFRMQLSRERTQ